MIKFSAANSNRLYHVVVALVVLCQVALLAWSAASHSPAWDEVGHLAAGISHWRFGAFDLYRVNPPLVRMVAAAPVALLDHKMDWREFGIGGSSQVRNEFRYGERLAELNGAWYFWMLTFARWACIPFSLIGAYVTHRWAGELYGRSAALIALVLWCFCPNVLGHGCLITPDCGAAALGVASAYAFWKWLTCPTWSGAIWAGVILGLAELTKFTLIALFVIWPVLWIVYSIARRRIPQRSDASPAALPSNACRARSELTQVGLVIAIAVYVVNVGYGFDGSFRPLGDYAFVSEAFGGLGDEGSSSAIPGHNRFQNTWLAHVPVPVPEDYLLGIDLQRVDFERGMLSYLHGEWRVGGWWYYYLYALGIKVPVGVWVLAALGVGAGILGLGYTGKVQDEVMLLAPLLVVLALVSSQTGFNHHLRYVLPVFPFAFIWMSKVGRAIQYGHRKVAVIVLLALAWCVGSSLYYYPHSLSYFNEFVGGPTRGHFYLDNSNTDWGQDLFYLKKAIDEHPEIRQLTLAYAMPLIDPHLAGIDYSGTPPTGGPQPGWHAISVNLIHVAGGGYEYFLKFDPVVMAGYSIYVYHITLNEVNRVRREMALPELPSGNQASARQRMVRSDSSFDIMRGCRVTVHTLESSEGAG